MCPCSSFCSIGPGEMCSKSVFHVIRSGRGRDTEVTTGAENDFAHFDWSAKRQHFNPRVAWTQFSAYSAHKNLAVAKSRKWCVQRTQSGIQSEHVSNYTRQTITDGTRVLWKESVHGLRTTFQYFAESFDGGKAAFEMRHLFLYFFFGTHFRIFVRKFLVHLRMVYASLQKLARPCSSPPPLDRVLHEVTATPLETTWSSGWTQLLCLDAAVPHISGCPLPENCDLYPSYWVFILGFLGHQGNIVRIWRHFRWSAFVTMDV